MGVCVSIRNIASCGLAAAGLTLLASGALAQTGAGSGGAKSDAPAKSGAADAGDKFKDVKITMSADQQNLLEALRTLMKAAKADFAIDDELKAGTATVHLKDVPFKDALATLIKVSTIPVSYEVKDGVYHFMRRIDPPAEDKPAESTAPVRPRFQTGNVPLSQIGSSDAMRKLTGPYDQPPPTQYFHSTLPGSHGSTSSFGFSSGGLLQSNGFRYNPDGSVSRTGSPPINIFGLLRGLLGGK